MPDQTLQRQSIAPRLRAMAPLTLNTPDLPPNFKAAIKEAAPASAILGLELLGFDQEAGAAQMAFNAGDRLCNKWGGLQGGMVAAMLDDAIAFSAGLKLDWGQITPTLEFKTSFLTAGKPGRFYAEGRTVRRGRSILFLEADLEDEEGTLIARATGTASIVTLKKKS